jgi:fibronectin type 3 domain-containing protein
VSDRSAKATAVVPDGEKPSRPGTLTATAVGPSQVDLAWGASTDNIGVTGYRIYRDSVPIIDVGTVTSYSDTGVTGGTTYAYEVRALDAAGNASDPTNSASATTPAASATYTLSADADAKVDSSTPTTNYATANLRADASGGSPTVESFLRFTVANVPAGSVRSAKLRVYAYTNTVDGPAVYASNPAWTETAINWNNRPPRTSGVAADVANVPSNTWIEYDVTSLVTGNGTYSFDLATTTSDGVDIYPRENANLSLRPQLVVTTGAPDVTKPFPPSGLTATVRSGTQVDLAWQAATDNVGVTGYEVLRNDSVIATLGAVTAYSDTNATGGSTYTYKVRALDAAGNRSDPSGSQTVTTPAAPSVQTFAAVADAEVNAGAPTTNYATAKLRTDNDSTPEETYLRFNVTGVAGTVTSAKLRVYAYTDSVDGPAVYASDPVWNETTINWNNRPARTGGPRDDKGAIATASWVEFDVTPFVTGNGTYSFDLAQTSTDGVDYRSREYTSNRPELVVGAQP